MAQDTFNFRDLEAHGKMTGDSENIACRELDRQKGLDSLNRGYLGAYLHDLAYLSGGDIERKMLQKAGFAEGDIKEDKALTPTDCPRCGTRNSWDGVSCSGCSGRSPSLTSTTHPPPQEKFYGIR